jgi:hypothetical protein
MGGFLTISQVKCVFPTFCFCMINCIMYPTAGFVHLFLNFHYHTTSALPSALAQLFPKSIFYCYGRFHLVQFCTIFPMWGG